MIEFELMCRFSVEVGPIVSLGPGPLGERRVIEITGGSFEGPRMRGTVMGGGADWQIVRGDGVIDLDARYALKEERGGVIQVVSQGYRHGPPEVLAALGRGKDVDASKYFFRSIMRFETGAPELAWLNKVIAVASAERRARRVELTAYKLL
jgi:hypothetical protein